MFNNSLNFVQISSIHLNTPENHTSIISEFCPSSNLKNLLKVFGFLPISLIHEIVVQLVNIVELFHVKTSKPLNCLNVSDILIGKNNRVKLNIGFKSIFPEFYKEKKQTISFSNLKWRRVYLKRLIEHANTLNKHDIKEVLKIIDFFDLGVVLMTILTGGVEEINNSMDEMCMHTNECCCFFHCQCLKSDKVSFKSIFMANNLDKSFEDFICLLTRFNFTYSLLLDKIKKNVWINKVEESAFESQEIYSIAAKQGKLRFENKLPNEKLFQAGEIIIDQVDKEKFPVSYAKILDERNNDLIVLAEELEIPKKTLRNELDIFYNK